MSRYYNNLVSALHDGLITVADVRQALHRTLKLRFRLGLFDPVEGALTQLVHKTEQNRTEQNRTEISYYLFTFDMT